MAPHERHGIIPTIFNSLFSLASHETPRLHITYIYIYISHVIIIIKSELSTFPIVIIFFRGCVPEMFVTSHSVTCCIYVPGKPGIGFHYYCAVYDECKWSDTFWFADRKRLFAQYTISLSPLCKLIWRHWTYKMSVRYILSSVWVRLSIFSQLSIMQYVGLCVFSLPVSLVMIERIYVLCLIIIIKSEVWTVTHCLGLGHETMVCAACLSIFLCPVFKNCCRTDLVRNAFETAFAKRQTCSVINMPTHCYCVTLYGGVGLYQHGLR